MAEWTLVAALIVAALNGDDVIAALRAGTTTGLFSQGLRNRLQPKVAAIAAGSYITKQPPEIRGTGYIIDALEAALWALASHDTFEQGVLAAVNLGDDADTTAAIYGQLAGAIYGVEAIPERWLEKLVMGTEITQMADDLLALTETVTEATSMEHTEARLAANPRFTKRQGEPGVTTFQFVSKKDYPKYFPEEEVSGEG